MDVQPKLQKQHRISQVYLKQFGFKREAVWYIQVLNLRKDVKEEILIEKFSTEINAFDLPFKDFEIKRHFEKTSSIVENRYPTIIRNIEHQGRLIPKDKDYLCHFLPNLKCRNGHYRMFLFDLLRIPEGRQGLINEITLIKGEKTDIKALLNIFKEKDHVNIAIGFLMNHLVSFFRYFNFVILKAPIDSEWLSTDNPVHMDLQGINEFLMTHETEVYFALSPKYCLFIYNDDAEKKTNPLRNLLANNVVPVDHSQFHEIQMRILARDENFTNDYDHILIPTLV